MDKKIASVIGGKLYARRLIRHGEEIETKYGVFTGEGAMTRHNFFEIMVDNDDSISGLVSKLANEGLPKLVNDEKIGLRYETQYGMLHYTPLTDSEMESYLSAVKTKKNEMLSEAKKSYDAKEAMEARERQRVVYGGNNASYGKIPDLKVA